MEATRFFFADAAAEQLVKHHTGTSIEDWVRILGDFSKSANVALAPILQCYLHDKSEATSDINAAQQSPL